MWIEAAQRAEGEAKAIGMLGGQFLCKEFKLNFISAINVPSCSPGGLPLNASFHVPVGWSCMALGVTCMSFPLLPTVLSCTCKLWVARVGGVNSFILSPLASSPSVLLTWPALCQPSVAALRLVCRSLGS